MAGMMPARQIRFNREVTTRTSPKGLVQQLCQAQNIGRERRGVSWALVPHRIDVIPEGFQ